ncbi:MAG: cofactor-independent phosphoglycerate mutase [Coriobacteriia bacterium]|nr:cofactor-independent phosphoglycerate mutase [Coriobacteriia bacterium]
MKHVVVILDGAAGFPLQELDGKTTLEAAKTPNLDALARDGLTGLAKTVPDGMEASSSTACESILGYDPEHQPLGRGGIEATSMGIKLTNWELALRLNLVTIEDGKMKSYSAGNISSEESHEIIAELSAALDDEVFRIHPGIGYRHILVITGYNDLVALKYTPPHDISDKMVLFRMPKGENAGLLMDYMRRAREVLAESPVNARRIKDGKLPATDVWLFWPGLMPWGLKPFAEKYGVSAVLTSGVDLLNGLARLTGIGCLEIAGVTAGSDTDYAAQAEGALAALEDHDVVFIHIEAPDEAGHAGDIAEKIAAIEAIDREIVSRVREAADRFDGGMRILAMPDHFTPIATKTHSREPVPFVLWGEGIVPDSAEVYSEAVAAGTRLRVDPGFKIMAKLLAKPKPEEGEKAE